MTDHKSISEIELGFNREVILRCADEETLKFLALNRFMGNVRFDPLTSPHNAIIGVRQLAPKIQDPEDEEWLAAIRRLYGGIVHVEREVRTRGVAEYPLRNISLAMPASELLVGATAQLGSGADLLEPTEDSTYLNLLRPHLVSMGDPSNRSTFKGGLSSLCVILEFGVPSLDNMTPQDF